MSQHLVHASHRFRVVGPVPEAQRQWPVTQQPVAHVVLVAHGSRDPRAAATVRALRRAVATARPDVAVHDAYLDFEAPHLSSILADLTGDAGRPVPVIVVPLLLSAAYHARTDIPSIVATARQRGAWIEVADVLTGPIAGGDGAGIDLIVTALRRRLRETGSAFDRLVLGAAGTRDPDALAAIDVIATALGHAEGLPCVAGYASGAGRTIADAVRQAHAAGAHNVGIAAYFVAPGLLYDRICLDRHADQPAGLVSAAPLGDADEIVAIASRRIDECLSVIVVADAA